MVADAQFFLLHWRMDPDMARHAGLLVGAGDGLYHPGFSIGVFSCTGNWGAVRFPVKSTELDATRTVHDDRGGALCIPTPEFNGTPRGRRGAYSDGLVFDLPVSASFAPEIISFGSFNAGRDSIQ